MLCRALPYPYGEAELLHLPGILLIQKRRAGAGARVPGSRAGYLLPVRRATLRRAHRASARGAHYPAVMRAAPSGADSPPLPILLCCPLDIVNACGIH